ncbi:hypothetical protein F5Y19DRAFT_478770 [Xylariaceae sp. FL1651]|nr:hypothetical protein F5Y19DRAFT_478770 [Xylariaceae sp. FL1651]
MKYFSAQVLLGLCLSGVLADLPYHNFEGRDANPNLLSPSHTIESHPHHHHPTGTGASGHHHHPHSSATPQPEMSTLRHEPHHHHNGTHTSHPHHHHPPPSSSFSAPPFPTTGHPFPRSLDEGSYTMHTVTRTRAPSGGFPHGTGRPHPHHHKKGVGEPCNNVSECEPCGFQFPRRTAECGLNTEGQKVCLCVRGKPFTPQ